MFYWEGRKHLHELGDSCNALLKKVIPFSEPFADKENSLAVTDLKAVTVHSELETSLLSSNYLNKARKNLRLIQRIRRGLLSWTSEVCWINVY